MKIAFIGVGGIAGNYRGSPKKTRIPQSQLFAISILIAQQLSHLMKTQQHILTTLKCFKKKTQMSSLHVSHPEHTQHKSQIQQNQEQRSFVAKPVAQDLETAKNASKVITEANVINQVGYMARYSDITDKAKELVGDRILSMGIGRFLARMGANHPWWGKFEVSRGQMVEQDNACL